MCMSLRGVQKLGAKTVTSAMRGLVREDPRTRQEFLALTIEDPMTTKETYVIVGASLTGAKAAETLRDEGFDGRVVLIGEETERPYERPPLSKDYLRGEAGRDKVYVHRRASTRTGTSSCGSAARVAVDTGPRRRARRRERIRYDGCCWRRARSRGGSDSRSRPLRVLYLRSVEDSMRSGRGSSRGGSVVVVGAGWIGVGGGRLRAPEGTRRDGGRPAGRAARARARPRGRRDLPRPSRRQRRADAWGPGSRHSRATAHVERVRTSDGRDVECDLVVVGVGVMPRTQLAAAPA